MVPPCTILPANSKNCVEWTQEYDGMDMNEEKSDMTFYGCDNMGDFDTDGDGIVDRLDLDSDNDGCPDSNEYYGDPNADGGDGGQFGPGPDPVATNIDGTVSNPGATYAGLLEPVRTAVSITLNTAMPDQTANIGGDVSFTADASALMTTDFTTDPDTTTDVTPELLYQWYVSTDAGSSYTVLTGETNATLTVPNVQLTNDEYIFQVAVSHSSNGCTEITDDALLSIAQNPAIALVKTASIAGTVIEGDAITYTFTVTNTGDVTLTGVAIDDALTGSVDLPVGPSILAPGETGTATASYPLTQADIETGIVSNTATVTGSAPNSSTVTDTSGTALDNDDSTETPIAQNPAIALVKTSEYKGDPLQAQLDDIITFSFTVHNTGNITIDNIIVDDPLLGGNISGPLSGDTNNNSILEPTETWVYEADYNITQPEVDTGVVENQATVSGTGSNGDPVNDMSGTSVINDDMTTTLLPPFSGISLVKTATFNDENGNGYPEAGETIGYSFTVENIGYQTLTTITVNDPMVTVAGGPIANLDPGDADNSTFTASYTITQGDIDAGTIQNTATATGKNPANDDISDTSGTAANNNDPTITILTESPALEATKIGTITVPPGVEIIAVGNEIIFLIWVQNTGNVTLHGITLTDTFRDANGNMITLASGPVFEYADQGSAEGDLNVGETANYSASYIIAQSEIDAGGITNSVVADGFSPMNSPVSDISDDGVDTDGNTEDDITDIPFGEDPSIEATKTASITDNGDGQTGVDDVITYTITVQNTGNVTLDNVTLTDTMQDAAGNPLTLSTGPTFTSSDQGSSAGDLLVGETATYTATYQIAQSDVDTGGVVNSAVATGDSPAGTQVNDISDNGNDADGNTEDDTTDTTMVLNPAIALVKTASVGGTGTLGDDITYTFTVTNTGDVTLTGVVIDDALTGSVGLTVSPATLAPGETGTATASHTIAQLDMDAGNVSNTATATGTAPDSSMVTDISGTTLENDDSTDIPITQNPAIALVKTASVGGTGTLGDDITYTFTVTNTGDVTLTGIVINDALTGSVGLTVSPSTLAPGEIGTATARYTIDQLDIEAGNVSNSATVTGTAPNNGTVTDTSGTALDNDDRTDTPITQDPAIALVKTASVGGRGTLGDDITYTFTVTNTGDVTLTGVVIDDALTGSVGLTVSPSTLAPGETGTATASYTIDQLDMDSGNVSNTATATGTAPDSSTVTDISGTALDNDSPTDTPLVRSPEIMLWKEGTYQDTNGDGLVNTGDHILFSFTVENTGNMNLMNVTITDPLVTVNGGPITTLGPGASDSTTFTAQYLLSQEDIEVGAVYNIAMAEAEDINGNPVTAYSRNPAPLDPNDPNYDPGCADCTITVLNLQPAIAIVKRAMFNDENNDGMAQSGETITYLFAIENTGKVLLTDINVDDPLPGVIMDGGPISLGVGESDHTTFSAVYAITPQDILQGSISNQAVVTAMTPTGATVSDLSHETDTDGDGATITDINGCVLRVYNAVSPNNDGLNDFLKIEGMECYPDNTVQIFNRWGILVFEVSGYDNATTVFRGFSDGRSTIKRSEALPAGTYFYVLHINGMDGKTTTKNGYLNINR
tara:strand:+ start:9325 stop:14112 length:4788 start_codon:yes stop_codon:yes gene_type:complete